MELVLGIVLVGWIAGSLVVAGLCLAAARGDAALEGGGPTKLSRLGRRPCERVASRAAVKSRVRI